MALRGNSGIPTETRLLAAALPGFPYRVDYLAIPASHSNIYNLRNFTELRQAQAISDLINGKSHNGLVQKLRKLVRSTLSIGTEHLLPFSNDLSKHLLQQLQISNYGSARCYTTKKDLSSIYSRSVQKRATKIDTKGFDFYIQQHVDPISVPKGTIHIVRLHDLLPLTHPAFFRPEAIEIYTYGLRVLIQNRNITWVTDTQSQANTMKRFFGEDSDIRVIGCPLKPDLASQHVKSIKRRANQFLVVNTLEPRKQTELIVESFNFLYTSGRLSRNAKLIIVGKHGWLQDHLVTKLNSGVFGKNVQWHQEVSEFELQKLYYESEYVVSASLAEGFGLPPLEGAARGAIPIVSNISAHMDNFGKNAVYFEANSAKSLMSALESVSGLNKYQKEKMVESSRKTAGNFSATRIMNLWTHLLDELLATRKG